MKSNNKCCQIVASLIFLNPIVFSAVANASPPKPYFNGMNAPSYNNYSQNYNPYNRGYSYTAPVPPYYRQMPMPMPMPIQMAPNYPMNYGANYPIQRYSYPLQRNNYPMGMPWRAYPNNNNRSMPYPMPYNSGPYPMQGYAPMNYPSMPYKQGNRRPNNPYSYSMNPMPMNTMPMNRMAPNNMPYGNRSMPNRFVGNPNFRPNNRNRGFGRNSFPNFFNGSPFSGWGSGDDDGHFGFFDMIPSERLGEIWDDMLAGPTKDGDLPGPMRWPQIEVPDPFDVGEQLEDAAYEVPSFFTTGSYGTSSNNDDNDGGNYDDDDD